MKDKKTPPIRFKGFTDDWEQRKLGELAVFNPKEELPDVFEYVDLESVVGTELLSHRTEEKATAPSRAQRLAHRGDLFYQTVRPYQKNNYLFEKSDEHYVFSTGYAQLRPFIDGYFLLILVQNGQFVKTVLDNCTGTSYPAINANDLAEIEVFSPKDEQEHHQIGTYFRHLDALIALHQRKHEKLKNIKKAMLEKMFPKKGQDVPEVRFKGFTDAWEQRKLSDVFDGLQNNTLSRAELNYDNGSVKNVHYGDVLIKFGDYIDASHEELPFITDDSKADKFKTSYLKDGDIIIADTAEDETVGKCTEIQGAEGVKLLSGLHTIPCRPKEKYGAKFLGYYMNSAAYHSQLIPLMQGIKVTSISKSVFQNTDMIIPKSIEEQTKIGDFFANLDNLIALHQRKLANLQNIKKAMLEKLFV
ncbi:restriction endonuclease subunit S [Pseudoramibacter alactolyticus]|uniref:restriction endonuclease subunit S n=1 Tax=Pseudoramibacter alactolyticus TaxID=113287 RepID=UPI00248DADED|nr:restriction endonuclease subunit S [Pseudoramibacter alactolyticus]